MSAFALDHRTHWGAYQHSADGPHFTVFVLFTEVWQTLTALRTAARLAAELRARIEIVVPQVVPYPLRIDNPPIHPSFWANHFKTLVEATEIDTNVHVYVCRDRREAVASALPPNSIVVIGARRPWWPTREWRFASWLRAKGHRVIFADPQSSSKETTHA